MKFIDLFAGLGGFHTGFSNNGFECVFASELELELRELYKNNHGIEPQGDITKIHEDDVPAHDVLCAGFPCQPFSLAGKKKGAKCPESGKLIDDVLRITKKHLPKFIVLENVPNILTIEEGKFWSYIKKEFGRLGYTLDFKIMNPTEFGIPQNRKRIFVVGAIDTDLLESFQWPCISIENKPVIKDILNSNLPFKELEKAKKQQLKIWQELLISVKLEQLSTVSIVAPEFGATYPNNFNKLSLTELKKYKGAYGVSLKNCKTWKQALKMMPNYVRKNRSVPNWLKESVEFSRSLYKSNKTICDTWKEKLDKANNSWQILEWRGYKDNRKLKEHIIQFRASGIRISKPINAPSLVAMTPTQIPIIGSEMRYLGKHEAAKLQNLHTLRKLPENTTKAFKALGNAVNAKIVELIADNIKRTISAI